jgi:hypothetical protein
MGNLFTSSKKILKEKEGLIIMFRVKMVWDSFISLCHDITNRIVHAIEGTVTTEG